MRIPVGRSDIVALDKCRYDVGLEIPDATLGDGRVQLAIVDPGVPL